MTRGKFYLTSVTQYSGSGTKLYKFFAVSDNSTPENQRFTKYTPSGNIEINVDNPNVNFEFGKYYYVDFTEADLVK